MQEYWDQFPTCPDEGDMEDLKKAKSDPIYEGSELSDIDMSIIMLRIKSKHDLSETAVDDVLAFCQLIIGHADNKAPQTWVNIHDKLQQWGKKYYVIHVCTCMDHIYTGMPMHTLINR